MNEVSNLQRRFPRSILIGLLILVFALILLRTAWVGDDAYIAFRTVDNLVNGYGLTWNVDERVQAFTCPLWVILLSGFYALTGDIYYTSLLLSLAVTLAALWLLSFRVSVSRSTAVLVLSVAWMM